MGRPCSWTGIPYIFGPGFENDPVRGQISNGDLHAEAVKALHCYPYSPGALQVRVIGPDSSLAEMSDQVAYSAPVQWNELTPAEQATFNRWDAEVRRVITSTLRHTMGSEQYEAGTLEVSRLADSVRPEDHPQALFRYMRRIVMRDLYCFMVNGYVPIRGG